MRATITRAGPGAIATTQYTFAPVAMDRRSTRERMCQAVGMGHPARPAHPADEERRRLDNLVQVIDGRARPYTEVTTQ